MDDNISAVNLADMPLQALRGVGDKLAEKLTALQIFSVQDLLFHLPLRYQDRTRLWPIGSLQVGSTAQIEGEVERKETSFRGRRTLLCRIADGTGSIVLRFFHFSHSQQQQLGRGARVRCFGEVRTGATGLEIIHPEYTLLGAQSPPMQASFTPVYPSTHGVHQLLLRKLTEQALQLLAQHQPPYDLLPEQSALKKPFASLRETLQFVHRPPPNTSIEALRDGRHPAIRRLAFEELVAYRLALLNARHELQAISAPKLRCSNSSLEKLYAQFGFTLTGAQQRVRDEVLADIGRAVPMLRLVQGDVGAGKTVVAAMASLAATNSGYQVALMAPTEILAEQHFANFKRWFSPLNIQVGWLIGKLPAGERRKTQQSIKEGHIHIVVGTHALFQNNTEFRALGLSIIDEQHRFGVDQRLALRDKGYSKISRHSTLRPHQLTLSATPIPRTLAMTTYADLDCSVLDELPPGRTAVTTVALPNSRREELIQRIGAAVADGQQVYWVCTLIDESEALKLQTVEDAYRQIGNQLPNCRVAMIHGRMKNAEKAAIMQSFKAAELNVLVATTVIEVGVDVANASLMIIENSERLGLSQLHQLRGRIGRGTTQSSCVLLYQPPLSNNARERIAILRETSDGFMIAERDLKLRGAGEVLGTQQAGEAQWRIADLSRDGDMLDDIRRTSDTILRDSPKVIPDLIRRWRGNSSQYRNI